MTAKKYGKYIAFAVLAFILGAGLAVVRLKYAAPIGPATDITETSAMENVQAVTPAESGAAAGTYQGEDSTLLEEGRIIPDAPAMPEATAENVTESTSMTPAPAMSASNNVEDETATAAYDDQDATEEHINIMPAGWHASFSMVDQNNNAVTDQSWPGKYIVVFFGFTHCPDICPVTLDKMTEVFNNSPDLLQTVQPVFVTVDPLRDTAPVMKEYLASYHASIIGLTGTQEQVNSMVKSFNTYVAKGEEINGAYVMNHMPSLYVVSPDRTVVNLINNSLTPEDMGMNLLDITTPVKTEE